MLLLPEQLLITTLKNRANVQESVEALEESESNPVQFADPKTLGGDELPGFEEIHRLCGDTLDQLEWRLISALYLDEDVTKNDLMKDEALMADLGLAKGSPTTRWRGITKKLGLALSKMRSCLEQEHYFLEM